MAGLLLAGGVFTANAQKDSKEMPRSAAFVGRDIVELGQVGEGSDTYKSNGFYQLSFEKGDSVLAMLWDATNGKYRLMARELKKANTPLDNTLWQVSASWDKTSGTINYVFVNKATLLPLQVGIPDSLNVGRDAFIEGSVTNWVWNQNVKRMGTSALRSTVNVSESVCLTLKSDTVQVMSFHSDTTAYPFASALKVKPVEAGRVILTADQINSKLANVTGTEGTHVEFTFDPNVKNPIAENAKNILTDMAWVARGWSWELKADSTLAKKKGFEIPDFKVSTKKDTLIVDSTLVQFIPYLDYQKDKEDLEKVRVLMVDTAYYDDAMNNKYNLKLAAKKLEKQGGNYPGGAALDTILPGKTPAAYATFQDQSLFKVIYEPTYDRIMLQAKQVTFIAKDSLAKKQSWALQKQAADSLKYDGFVVASKLDTASLHTDTVAYNPIKSNLIKLVYLTPDHSELTVDVSDSVDVKAEAKGYNGALTTIKMNGTKTFDQWTFANITEGYYYIQNARTKATSLIPVNGWAYQDLTATNASEGGNVVYSAEKFERMPSAQWNITGNAGFFTIKNRESEKAWSTQYWYAVKDANGNNIPNVYTNYGTFGANGIATVEKDTIRLTEVPKKILTEDYAGYLHRIGADVGQVDTVAYTFKYVTPLDVNLGLTMGEDSVLVMKEGEAMNFKIEFANVAKTNKNLTRDIFYIYADEVSSNSSEATGYHNRKYIVLEGGKYRLKNFFVEDDLGETQSGALAPNGGTNLVNPDKDADGLDTEFVNGYSRAPFFIKEIGEAGYVLVDPRDQDLPATAQGNMAHGIRMAMDQTTLTMRANGLASVAENVYSNSLFRIEEVAAGNYSSELAYADVVKVFSNDYPEVAMYENDGLLAMSSLEAGRTYNTALFVDTANVRSVSNDKILRSLYMFVLRPEFDPNCNYPSHAHHAVEGDYLMYLADSAAVDAKYTWENKKFSRLGFIPARHEGDILTVKSTGEEIDLSTQADQFCTFALRYVDTNRDAFYLETLFKKGTPGDKHNNAVADQKGWVRWHNGVPVVVDDLSQAGKFNFEATSDSPVSNETIGTSTISVVATNGGVIVKGAEGKKVVISNVLGQTIANTVITSSEATIAAPAGVVYVKVDGEAAVPAIVK